jgi:alpha-D-ribose 1-methylphosphonate 5-triphosphate synthase subunit PhnH
MTMSVDLSTLSPGFADPVRDAQAVFRGVLDALARPGTRVEIDRAEENGGYGAAGVVALTLLDFETPVWLGGDADSDFANWLRFHCSCPLVTDAHAASFIFVAAAQLSDLGIFNTGTEKYPDTAATVVITVPALTGGPAVALEGPGIVGRVTIAPQGLASDFWTQAIANRAQFQLGVDIIFAAGDAILGLPRSTRIIQKG